MELKSHVCGLDLYILAASQRTRVMFLFLLLLKGIFAYLNYRVPRTRKEIFETLVKGLQRLEYRGYDSAGKTPNFAHYKYTHTYTTCTKAYSPTLTAPVCHTLENTIQTAFDDMQGKKENGSIMDKFVCLHTFMNHV